MSNQSRSRFPTQIAYQLYANFVGRMGVNAHFAETEHEVLDHLSAKSGHLRRE